MGELAQELVLSQLADAGHLLYQVEGCGDAGWCSDRVIVLLIGSGIEMKSLEIRS